uniref:HP3 n=1 Tax=Sesame deltaflexivirus 1 TaxID=2794418 RepID=A0A7T5QZC4_9VIRU|nr:HP3 [Sesame deltaflexivirus 1]
MSELLGETKSLRTQTVDFNAVHTILGPASSGHFLLSECAGLKQLLPARAVVEVVSESLSVQVVGPASASKAVSAHVAVIPANAPEPTTEAQVLTISGSAFVQHSLYVGAVPAQLRFASEVAHQLKPTPVFGQLPKVVYHCTVTGGATGDKTFLRLSGTVTVEGVGYVSPW